MRIAALVVALVGFLVVPSARAATPDIAFTDAAGIHVVGVKQLGPRDYNVSVLSAALGRAVDVRILVPDDYASTPDVRLPVLYLFHGTSGRASDWINAGDAEAATAGLDLIVVMPDAGFDGDGGGWFTNWVNTKTALGPSQWETFHINQLVPWVDANLRTITARTGRAVAGLSQGGFGSMTYAARHPDLFISAAAFSGAPDIDYNPLVAAGATAVIEATAVGLDGVDRDAMFGSRVTREVNWQGHDPADLVTNLRGVDLWLYTATGVNGTYDGLTPNPGASGIEGLTHSSTISFVQRAQQLGVPVHLDDYVLGTHTWAYWARDLREYLAPLMQTFANPPAPPAKTSYESIDKTWTQWGWTVTVYRPEVQQFSALSDADRHGFTLGGTAAARVTTPPFYRPGSVAAITFTSASGYALDPTTATADAAGRLHFTVSLGGNEPPAAVASNAIIGVPGVPSWGGVTTVSISAPD